MKHVFETVGPFKQEVLPSDCKTSKCLQKLTNREKDRTGIGQLVEHLTEKLGLSPLCSKSQLPVQTPLQCAYSPHVQLRASTSECMTKIPSTGSHTTGLRNTIHTAGISSTALAAAVPYPGKAIQISH